MDGGHRDEHMYVSVAMLSIRYMYPNIGGLYIPRCGAEVSHSGMSSPPTMSTYQSPPLLVGHSG